MHQHIRTDSTVLLLTPLFGIMADTVFTRHEDHRRGTVHISAHAIMARTTGHAADLARHQIRITSQLAGGSLLDALDGIGVEFDLRAGEVLLHVEADLGKVVLPPVAGGQAGDLVARRVDHVQHLRQPGV